MKKIVVHKYNLETTAKTLLTVKLQERLKQQQVRVVTMDQVSPADNDVLFYVYYDYSWRQLLHDKTLSLIPYEKRVLVMGEPACVNPSLYYISLLRNKFKIVFAWDLNLLKRNSNYVKICVPILGLDYKIYKSNLYKSIGYTQKKLLTSVSMNRWSYMPQSSYRLRKKAYAFFTKNLKNDFDLYGKWWNKPIIFYEKWFGYNNFSSWQGEIAGAYDAKLDMISKYKFSLCFENNPDEPGYVSEKIVHCMCARSVPIYFGPKDVDEHIPQGAYINWRDFKDFKKLTDFIKNMSESQYQAYIDKIDEFMNSDKLNFFTEDNLLNVIIERLGL